MKHIFILLLAFVFISCKKEKAQDSGEYTDVIYEIETSDTGFIYVRTVEYDQLDTTNQPIPAEWPVGTTGTLRKTVRIKRGFRAEIIAAHTSSDRWTVRIRNANGRLLASANPTFFPAPLSFFYGGFSITVD